MIYQVLIFGFYALASGGGLLILKMAMSETPIQINIEGLIGLALNLKFLAGFGLYALGFLSWLFILSKFKLNIAFPIATSLFFIVSGLGSYFILKESFTTQQIAGTILCFLGVVLISIK